MAISWVVFDLNGTLVDPSVLAQPLGDTAADEALVQAAFDGAIVHAMVTTLTGATADFRTLVEGSLRRELELAGRDPAAASAAIDLLGSMPAFIEAPAALERLRGEGIRLAVLTQSSGEAAEAVLRFAGLRDRMDLVMGCDEVGAFKPDPRPYRAVLERAGAAAADACLVAAHWWDVTGAGRAGMRTGWVARRERLLRAGVPEPDVRGSDLAEVAERIVATLAV